MLIRIVKMTFKKNEVENFLKVFEASKTKIRNFEGCQPLELWQEKSESDILFTYSWWQDDHCLQNYRQSELFAATWAQTKILFAAKPEAWSVDVLKKID